MLADVPDTAQQVVVVSGRDWDSQRAVLRRYAREGLGWRQVGRPVPAWVGRNGFAAAARRQQNSAQTPAGTFSLPLAFGARAAAGVDLPYRRITADTYWPYDPRDPRTYNVLQSTRSRNARWRDDGQWSERLVDYGRQYRFAVVIGYNLPSSTYRAGNGESRTRNPVRTDKGGGIFLHVWRQRPTAGCVAIPLPAMRTVLRWLDAGRNPLVVIGPRAVTTGWRTASPGPH